MKRKIKYLMLISCFLLTGCSLFKNDKMENINIITTIYPLEYVTNYLYGDSSVVNSIYPDDTNIDNYKLTDKQLKDNSNKDLFIYMGLAVDRDIAVELVNRNPNLKLINATFGMEYKKDISELWLNPSNLIMIMQNIKNGLDEYIDNTFLKQEIEQKYQELKMILSEVDANLKNTIENAKNKTIYTNSKSLLFLERYGLKVYVVHPEYELYEKNLALLSSALENEKVRYFFYIEDSKLEDNIQKLVDNNKIKAVEFRNLKNNYVNIMNTNIENLKKEIY